MFIILFLFFIGLCVIRGEDSNEIGPAFSFSRQSDRNPDLAACVSAIQIEQRRVLADIFHREDLRLHGYLYFDPAYHGNVGDNWLAIGGFNLLLHQHVPISTCEFAQGGQEPCGTLSKWPKNSAAFFQPGGNWGDLWPRTHLKRLQYIRTALQQNFTLISLPQSLHYRNPKLLEQDAHFLERAVNDSIGYDRAKSQLILTWRQRDSYQTALNAYPFASNRLMPDLAFTVGMYAAIVPQRKKVDILFLLRQDKESMLGRRAHAVIATILQSQNITFKIGDWSSRPSGKQFTRYSYTNIGTIQGFDFNERLASSSFLVASARVVITDRLHASIVSTLNNVPVIYIDQLYRKIEMTREAAFNSHQVCAPWGTILNPPSANIHEAIVKARSLLNTIKS